MKQEEQPILVAIHCLVYNHEPYLRDCFEGFVMQKTNFRFVAIVHEDCSTDHSADIIREYEAKYPDIFRPIYEIENQWHKTDGSLGRIMNAAINATGAKYIAMCEGDDYWTDPYKLQKQVDFMEAHPECSLCCHRYKIYNQSNSTWEDDYVNELFIERPNGFYFSNKDNFYTWITKTNTLLYRANAVNLVDLKKYKYSRDVHLNYHLLNEGKGFCLPFVAAVYRKQEGGVFSQLSTLEKQKISFMIYQELLEHNQHDHDLQVYFDFLQQNFEDNIRSIIYHRCRTYNIKEYYKLYLH